MKNALFILVALVAFSFSCKRDPIVNNQDLEPITFEFQDTIDFPVPSSIGLNIPWILPSIDIQSGFANEIVNANELVYVVEDITLSALTLELRNPPGVNFSFLKHMTLFLEGDDGDKIELAHRFNVSPTVGTTLEFEPSNHQLDDFIKSDSYKLDAQLVVDELLLQDIELRAYMTFKVTLTNY